MKRPIIAILSNHRKKVSTTNAQTLYSTIPVSQYLLAQNITPTRPKSKAAATAILMGTVLLISTLMVSNAAVPAISTPDNNLQNTLAQTLPQTVIHRDLVIDLGNGVQTNAQLTMPAVGSGPFPVCCLCMALVRRT
jgi:hypothetical protein